jgi:hypothetical protein
VTWAPAGRDSRDVDALVTDRYLETLLAAHARGAESGPASLEGDPILRQTMARLARDLPRFHPSFRFEEALAQRLATAAARIRAAEPDPPTLAILPDGLVRVIAPADLRTVMGRPLWIGGALTSAAISLAGAAFLAWRLRRPPRTPMARAVRAVARGRLS